MEIQIVLVEPRYDGNVGSVARVMKNFGFRKLVLVNPCRIGDFGRAMASHARDILEGAQIISSVDEIDAEILVGTTSVVGRDNADHLRYPYLTPEELAERIKDVEGRVAILFGREDFGLLNEELEKCHMIVRIPTEPEYPSLNLSHSVAVILYELRKARGTGGRKAVSRENVERLMRHIEELLDEIEYPEHKKDKTLRIIFRIVGRAILTPREYMTLMGVIRRLRRRLKLGEKSS
ncbi:MAG: tRNA/rRNA methyltransferase [Archaeoglobi archaeon]|nr:RNA methyltransferase [Candidatus Mnemosynella bozhongmuii]MDI3502525.1 tRNA/rRNA methyltransferase [Archaeoglobi archaeon]MDK2781910.1 tRNA/rRNA methyltransferase [Archaeoglobi archaeon]